MIPVTVITGFLGSGKTSLIASALDGAPEKRIGVIVNDLGESSIDLAYLHGGEHVSDEPSELIRAVAGGVPSGMLLRAILDEVHYFHELPERTRPEAILVETSGAGDPEELVRALGDHARVVVVVDTSAVEAYRDDESLRPIIEAQLAAADVVVANKWDRSGWWKRRRAVAAIRAAAPAAMILRTEFGRVPLEELVGAQSGPSRVEPPPAQSGPSRVEPPPAQSGPSRVEPPPAQSGPSRVEPPPAQSGPSRVEPPPALVATHLVADRPFHPARLEAWLRAPWPGIIRVKGFVWIASDMDGVYVVDAAGPQREIGLEGTWYAAIPEAELPDDPAIVTAASRLPYGDRRQSLTIIGTPTAVAAARVRLESDLLSPDESAAGPGTWKTFPDPLTGRFQSR